jgi:transposase
LVEPMLPEPSGDGRPEEHSRREIADAILYLVHSGCPWRYLPADVPPWQTVYWYFNRWEEGGVTDELLAALRVKAARGPGGTRSPPRELSTRSRSRAPIQCRGTPAAMTPVRGRTTIQIVHKPADQRGFAVHPRRWVVERTLPWLTLNRRLARDDERVPEVSEAIIRWAAIAGMARRITPEVKRPGDNLVVPSADSDQHPHMCLGLGWPTPTKDGK